MCICTHALFVFFEKNIHFYFFPHEQVLGRVRYARMNEDKKTKKKQSTSATKCTVH